MSATPCTACAEYQAGERENVMGFGTVIHVCQRKRGGQWARPSSSHQFAASSLKDAPLVGLRAVLAGLREM